jgi:hypothetical protein
LLNIIVPELGKVALAVFKVKVPVMRLSSPVPETNVIAHVGEADARVSYSRLTPLAVKARVSELETAPVVAIKSRPLLFSVQVPIEF